MMAIKWISLYFVLMEMTSTRVQSQNVVQALTNPIKTNLPDPVKQTWARGRKLIRPVPPPEHRTKEVPARDTRRTVPVVDLPSAPRIRLTPPPLPAATAPAPVIDVTPVYQIEQALPQIINEPERQRVVASLPVRRVQPQQQIVQPWANVGVVSPSQTRPTYLKMSYLYKSVIDNDRGLKNCIVECEQNRRYNQLQKVKCEVNCYDLYYNGLVQAIILE